MEAPITSSASKNISVSASEEESGWTAYLEDFSCCNDSFVSSPSLASDAAWNGLDSLSQVRRFSLEKLKKSKNKKYSCDDDLEDTASSPVNSPKVSTLKQMEVNYIRTDDAAAGNFLGKCVGSSNFSELGRDEKDGKNVKIDNINLNGQCVDLRKRGLSLVSMSTLVNYLV